MFKLPYFLEIPNETTTNSSVNTNEKTKMIKKILFMLFFLVILTSFIERSKLKGKSAKQIQVQKQNAIQSEEYSIKNQTYKFQDSTFYEFKVKYRKQYLSAEEQVFRSMVFLQNKNKIKKHNSKINRKYNMALNLFADLTPQEFSQMYNTLYKSDRKVQAYAKQLVKFSKEDNLKYHLFSLNEVQIQQTVNQQKEIKRFVTTKENPEFDILNEILSPSIKNSLNFYQFKQKPKFLPLKQSISQDLLLSNFSSFKNQVNQFKLGNFTQIPIDWTFYAGKIKYQGICGACYTFATSDVLASLYSIYRFGFFVPLSTQQVLDCSTNGLTYGCNGGFLEGSYAYIQMKGIRTEKDYPYISAISGNQGTCKLNGGPFKIAYFKNIDEDNCIELVNQLNYGPISIGIAGYRLQFYKQGIFDDCNNYVDHAVVLIGYKGGVGWKIKNSWGPQWGMGGFAWIQDGNNCGICNNAVVASI